MSQADMAGHDSNSQPRQTSVFLHAGSLPTAYRRGNSKIWRPTIDPSKTTKQIRFAVDCLRLEIDTSSHLLELELLLLALAIGIQDAIAFPEFHCFASNQTGNTVLFAVVALQVQTALNRTVSPVVLQAIAVSLGFFIIGGLVTGQVANAIGGMKKQWWLIVNNQLQTLFVFIAAGLQYAFHDAGTAKTLHGLGVLGLIAFASGSQLSMVRGLQIPEITTATATGGYVDLFVDSNLFTGLTYNRGRNRRLSNLAMLLAGSFVGAAAAKYVGSGFALLLSSIIKTCVTLLFFFNKHHQD